MQYENRQVMGFSKLGSAYDADDFDMACRSAAQKNCRPTMLIVWEGEKKGIWCVSYDPGEGVKSELVHENVKVTAEAVEFMYRRWMEHCKY